ncbi:hypothetical protein IKG02_01820 [Candidatus Saccharibacteria bacterium]|nr:hypothetical protein [Candidatus Saccharibacteria bacterium]
MQSYSIGTFFTGLFILAFGALIVVFYQQISENIAHGVSSYDKVRLFGIIAIGIGLLIISNLHTVLLSALVNLVFPH